MLFLHSSACSHSFHICSSLLPNPNNNNNLNHKPSNNALQIPKSHSDAAIKAPTAPWMKGPLLLQPHDLLDLSNPRKGHVGKREPSEKALSGKEARGKKAMKKIAQTVEKLHRARDSDEGQLGSEKVGSFGESLKENEAEMGREEVGSFGACLGSLKENEADLDSEKVGSFGVCLESLKENEEVGSRRRMMPWEKDEGISFLRVRKERPVTAAELTLDKELLQRLRGEAATMRTWVKVMKAGVTLAVVDEIKRTWRTSELAMVKFDIPLCRNMDRAQEIVETKTGGLVVWRRKDVLVVYRGGNRQLNSKGSPKISTRYIHSQITSPHEMNGVKSASKDDLYWVKSNRSTTEMLSWNAGHKDSLSTDIQDMNCQPVSGSLYERECDRLLDGLGPRFIDWWMHKPLPVDADLLPEVVPGFETPPRLCPPHASTKLTDNELTYFRNISHPLPIHFVLGKNRRLQGLAAAMLKLWQKSPIAKIAIKYGVPNTDNEAMANELKRLTGGILLLRNKFYIIFHRGKDFLPRKVAALVEKRELELKSCQLHEEDARMRAIQTCYSIDELPQHTSTSGSLTEFRKIQTKYEDIQKVNVDSNIALEAEIYRLERELKEEQHKAFILENKIERSTRELSKLNARWTPAEQDTDMEIMTDEERQCFQKMGLTIRSYLVLGRRGVFDGILEGLHQHWKHREVVKVITMQRQFRHIMYTAEFLERESGGILVSIDKVKECHAIIIYRGKNYKRPSGKLAKNLLTKRKALARSLEMQRVGSLKFFAYQRRQTISDLKLKLAELQQRKEIKLKEFEN